MEFNYLAVMVKKILLIILKNNKILQFILWSFYIYIFFIKLKF